MPQRRRMPGIQPGNIGVIGPYALFGVARSPSTQAPGAQAFPPPQQVGGGGGGGGGGPPPWPAGTPHILGSQYEFDVIDPRVDPFRPRPLHPLFDVTRVISDRGRRWIDSVVGQISRRWLDLKSDLEDPRRGPGFIGPHRGPMISGWPYSLLPMLDLKKRALRDPRFEAILDTLLNLAGQFAPTKVPPTGIARGYVHCRDSLLKLLEKIRDYGMEQSDEHYRQNVGEALGDPDALKELEDDKADYEATLDDAYREAVDFAPDTSRAQEPPGENR